MIVILSRMPMHYGKHNYFMFFISLLFFLLLSSSSGGELLPSQRSVTVMFIQ